jgi:hypothetical protein
MAEATPPARATNNMAMHIPSFMMAPPSRALMIRALIPALEMNQLRPARCGLSHETRGCLSVA